MVLMRFIPAGPPGPARAPLGAAKDITLLGEVNPAFRCASVILGRATIEHAGRQVQKLPDITVVALFAIGLWLSGCAARHTEEGLASWYGPGFAGKPTASGERFVPCKRTAAHKTLPFGTRVRVTNLRNGRSVVVRINDRGPFVEGRIIDLSKGAARAIGMIDAGVVEVRLVVVKWPPGQG